MVKAQAHQTGPSEDRSRGDGLSQVWTTLNARHELFTYTHLVYKQIWACGI